MDDVSTSSPLPEASSTSGRSAVRRSSDAVARTISRAPDRLRNLAVDVVTMLATVVSLLRTPILLICLTPVVAGLILVGFTVEHGGPAVPYLLGVALVGILPAAWLAIRRHQLITALTPPDVAVAEISTALAPTELWSRVKDNLRKLPTGRRLRLRMLPAGIWRGIRLTAELREQLTGIPRLAPFLPGRLRGIVYLAASCLITGVALGAITVLRIFTALVGIA
jgi:hypothetical protein